MLGTASKPAEKSNEIVKSEPLPVPKFPDQNPHSNLMASIRSAGGLGKAKLRATALRTEKPPVTFQLKILCSFYFTAELFNVYNRNQVPNRQRVI